MDLHIYKYYIRTYSIIFYSILFYSLFSILYSLFSILYSLFSILYSLFYSILLLYFVYILFLLYLFILYIVHVVRECCQCTLGEGIMKSQWIWVSHIDTETWTRFKTRFKHLRIQFGKAYGFSKSLFYCWTAQDPQFVALTKNRPRFPGVHIVSSSRLQWASRHHCYTSCPCCCGYHFSVGLTNIGGGGSPLGGGKVDDSRWRAAARDILFAASSWIDLERSIWGKVSSNWARNGDAFELTCVFCDSDAQQ